MGRPFAPERLAALAALALATTLGCDAPTAVLPGGPTLKPASAPSPQLVPFRGTLVSEPATIGGAPCPAGTIRVTAAVTGTLSHLGRSTLVLSHCVNTSTGAVSGETVITAANGDQVFVSYSAQITPAGPGVSVLSGTFTITGGTGRFAGASGGGSIGGEQRGGITSPAVITVDGRISAVGPR